MSRPAVPIDDPLSVAFLVWCEEERVPRNTTARRRATLKSIGNAGAATREEVEAWWRSRAHLKEATRQNDLANLRTFYRWCQRWDHRADDPTVRIDAPKVPQGLPRPFSRDEVHRLLDALAEDLRRAVALGAYGGLRVSEAASADWSQMDYENNRLRVRGKGRKERLIGVSPILLDAIRPDTGGNIVTAGGKPYGPDALQRRVNRAIRAAGVDGTFHQLRHRWVTVGLAATGDLLGVSRAAGHASVTTTTRYAATSDEVLDQIAAAVAR